jgi:hypothetical protein
MKSSCHFLFDYPGTSELNENLCLLLTPLAYDCLQSQSHFATDGQSISNSWCRAPSVAYDRIFITLIVTVLFKHNRSEMVAVLGPNEALPYYIHTYIYIRSYFCGAPSLIRRWVCLLCMVLVLASLVFLGFESLGTRDHILLSDLRVPFRRLLRLAGSRWRYSNPSPHGSACKRPLLSTINLRRRPTERRHVVSIHCCVTSVPTRKCVYREFA